MRRLLLIIALVLSGVVMLPHDWQPVVVRRMLAPLTPDVCSRCGSRGDVWSDYTSESGERIVVYGCSHCGKQW